MSDGGGQLGWAEALREQVSMAKVQLAATFANVSQGRRKVAQQLERTAAKMGASEERRAQLPVVGDLHRRVLDALARGDLSGLTVREQRYAASQIEHAPPATMRAFLAAYPSNWAAFAAACMQRWETFLRLPDRSGYARLLAAAPRSVAFLHVTGRPQELLDENGPTVVAQRLPAKEPAQAMEALERLGFKATWQYTAIALAMWMRAQVVLGRASFLSLWLAAERDRTVEALLLPPLRDSRRSWFSAQTRPARVRGAVTAHAVFLASILRLAMREPPSSASGALWADLSAKLLASTMGDPRIPPESEVWRYAMRFDKDACRFFLERLFTEELSMFFEHAMSDRRRQAFWLRYVGSVRRTICILDRPAHARLTRKLAGADQQLASALARARRFSSSGEGVQAFCLYFDRHVVVEFSETGNAAYVYERGPFEEAFQQALEEDRCSSHSQLKRQRLTIGRIVHKEGWEDQARLTLAALGIHPA